MGRRPTRNLNLPPRLRARHKPSGRTLYYYDTGEKPRREIPLGADYALAVKKWSELELDANPRVAEIVTFRYVAERYQRDVLPRKAPRTMRENLRELAKLFEFFDKPPAPLERIDPIHVRRYLDWRTKGGRIATVTANRERALLSHIWNFAREKGYTAKANPCAGVKGFREAGRDVYVEADVFDAVHAAACAPLRDAMDLAYLGGQRPADTLRMAETDVRDGVLHVRQRKTGVKVRLRLVDDAGNRNALGNLVERLIAQKRALPVHALQLVLNEGGQPLTVAALRKRFHKARDRAIAKLTKDLTGARVAIAGEVLRQRIAGVMAFQFRDLRAKAGTDKAERAGDIRQAQRQLGHASLVMTEQYLRERRGDLVEPTK